MSTGGDANLCDRPKGKCPQQRVCVALRNISCSNQAGNVHERNINCEGPINIASLNVTNCGLEPVIKSGYHRWNRMLMEWTAECGSAHKPAALAGLLQNFTKFSSGDVHEYTSFIIY